MAVHNALAEGQLRRFSQLLHSGTWRDGPAKYVLDEREIAWHLPGLPGSQAVRAGRWRQLRPTAVHVKGYRVSEGVAEHSATMPACRGVPSGMLLSNQDVERLCQSGELVQALDAVWHMDQQGIVPSVEMYRSLLKACTKKKALTLAKQVHAHLLKHKLETTRYLGESVVKTLVKCDDLQEALEVFYRLPNKTVVSWSAVIAGHSRAGLCREALGLYQRMRGEGVRPNKYTFISLVKACSSIADLEQGKRIHADVVRFRCESELVIGTCLVEMYSKCGSIADAQAVFNGLRQRDVVSWTAMLVAYVQQGQAREALQLHAQMQAEHVPADAWIFVSVLQACGMLAEQIGQDGELLTEEALSKGKMIHSQAWSNGYASDVFVGSALISMYGKCQRIEDAEGVFDRCAQRSLVLWNAMLAVYAHRGDAEKALDLYDRMREEGISPNDRTFVSAFQACGDLAEKEEKTFEAGRGTKAASLRKGKSIHGEAQHRGYTSDVFVGSALISMYGKCGSILDAQHVFDGLLHRNVVSWNAMIAACAHEGRMDEALRLYSRMHKERLVPDDTTLTYMLQVCSNRGALDVCTQIHHDLILSSSDFSLPIANALIQTYGKCARMEDAQHLFNALPQPNVESWNALIAGYGRVGSWERSLDCCRQMQLTRLVPDGVTLLSILTACNHSGMVDKALECFKAMCTNHNISPEIQHYVTMVDLLGRSGYFTKVEDLLSTMPMQPNRSLWLCLLSACRKHGNVVLAKRAFECAVQLHPHDPAPYVVMSTIYAQAGMPESAQRVDELRQEAGAWKQPGQSWIDHQREEHVFMVAGNDSEKDIHDLLKDLSSELECSPVISSP